MSHATSEPGRYLYPTQGCRNVFKLGEDMIQNRQLLSDFQKEILSESL